MSTVQARNIVRMILGTSEVPLSTKQLFDLAGKRYADVSVTPTAIKYPSPPVKSKAYFERVMPPTPPRPTTHPIHSMTQLKNRVLSDLAARNEIQKIYTIKPPTSSHHQADPTKLATATPNPTSKSKSKSKSNVTPTITTHTTKAFLWRIHPESLSKPLPASPSQPEIEWKWVAPTKPAPKTHAQMYPLPKNIHLNLRRRRARVGKVMREKVWIKKVARAVAKGAKALAKKEEKEALLKVKVKKVRVKKPKVLRVEEPVAV